MYLVAVTAENFGEAAVSLRDCGVTPSFYYRLTPQLDIISLDARKRHRCLGYRSIPLYILFTIKYYLGCRRGRVGGTLIVAGTKVKVLGLLFSLDSTYI